MAACGLIALPVGLSIWVPVAIAALGFGQSTRGCAGVRGVNILALAPLWKAVLR